ncbi:MAG TPA: type II toxin-antitoxin system prevent-host-death family antitoxin [Candidatus Paceibacterota bacterium]|nr:type II toxin-antitoxin system prevent-host-death family antitoxin [Candidatus Paceibacterota bacterium]
MKTLTVSIREARTDLCTLIKQVQAGARITLTSHGRPAALLVPVEPASAPWRVQHPDDPKRYGDLQSPVIDPRPTETELRACYDDPEEIRLLNRFGNESM